MRSLASVGYAPTRSLVELVEQHVRRARWWCSATTTRGNRSTVRGLNATAQKAIAWTQAQLGSRQRAFLDGLLSPSETTTFCSFMQCRRAGALDLCHRARQAEHSMKAANAAFIFCGHVHERAFYRAPAAIRCPSAGAGRPFLQASTAMARDRRFGGPSRAIGNTAACYALADIARAGSRFSAFPTITFGRAENRSAGFPNGSPGARTSA